MVEFEKVGKCNNDGFCTRVKDLCNYLNYRSNLSVEDIERNLYRAMNNYKEVHPSFHIELWTMEIGNNKVVLCLNNVPEYCITITSSEEIRPRPAY
jgi:hypothetical protein